MANYTKLVDYAAKDALSTGNPSKVVRGTELDTEFEAIETAIATKADTAGATLTGATLTSATLTSPTMTSPSIGNASGTSIALSAAYAIDANHSSTTGGVYAVFRNTNGGNTNAATYVGCESTAGGVFVSGSAAYDSFISSSVSGRNVWIGVNNVGIGKFSATGLNITGALDATGSITEDGNQVLHAGNYTSYPIADSSVTYAKIQNVSAASRLIGRGSAGGAGVAEEISLGTGLSMSGTTLSSTSGPTLGTPVASTSGTSIDFTSIPATAKRITITFTGVSTNGSNPLLVQIGDSGGVETTGYTGRTDVPSAGTTSTAGIPIFRNSAANTTHGAIVLYLANSSANTWAASGVTILSDVAVCVTSAGTKSLSATLDRVRITSVGGTDTFDAGEINIQYD